MEKIPSLGYQKDSGRYYIYINRKRTYLGRDRDKADEQRRRIAAERLLHNGQPVPDHIVTPSSRMTVNEVLAMCFVEAERVYSHGHLGRVRQAFAALADLYGSRPAGEFGPVQLDAVRSRLIDRPNQTRPGKLSRHYVNSLIGVIQTWWGWAATKGMVPPSQATAVQLVTPLRKGRGGREVPRVLGVPAEVVDATLPWCGPVLRAMVQLQRVTGMRPGEVCRISRGEISTAPDQKLLTSDNQTVAALEVAGVVVWVYAPGQHKGEHRDTSRIIALGPQAQALIRPFLDRAPDACLFSPAEQAEIRFAERRKARKTRVQPSQISRKNASRIKPLRMHYTTSTYRQAILHAIAKARRAGVEIPPWFPNRLRHAAGTAISCAIDQFAAQAILGHSSPDTTAVYIDHLLKKACEVAAKLG